MSVVEIIVGCVALLVCAIITFVILMQDSKGGGLSSVITGTEMMSGESRSRSKEARQAKATKILAVALFVIIILVNVISALRP